MDYCFRRNDGENARQAEHSGFSDSDGERDIISDNRYKIKQGGLSWLRVLKDRKKQK
jgi:hypothetical protein